MNFGEALLKLRKGGNISRKGWNGKGMFLQLIGAEEWGIPRDEPSTRFQNRLPWIGMMTADKHFVPWVASQTDLLAEDWE
jgi:hypothetical protein